LFPQVKAPIAKVLQTRLARPTLYHMSECGGSLPPPKPLYGTSYSSLRLWLSCQVRWALLRVQGAPSQPGWARVGGRAVHDLTEQWEAEYSRDQHQERAA
jgi:hypothetical protein